MVLVVIRVLVGMIGVEFGGVMTGVGLLAKLTLAIRLTEESTVFLGKFVPVEKVRAFFSWTWEVMDFCWVVTKV